ncbi:MAG: small ribosomal subunit Rsm22 family protein [Bdellovibrio sp.]
MTRSFTFPASFESALEKALENYKLSLSDARTLAKNVLLLSDYFIQNPEGSTPWKETWAQIAYLCYFLPLNAARLAAVIHEGEKRAFFAGLENVVDFGAGLATASLTLAEKHSLRFHLVEQASEPQKLVENFFPQFQPVGWYRTWPSGSSLNAKKTLAVFSYSFTELMELPKWAWDYEALMIVEPSTQQDGRRLLELRHQLLQKGFHAWAPCTHEQACPLLTQSKHDWCHDRIHFTAPAWMQKIEESLPMKNRTLTMSYLLMRKTPPQPLQAARIVGDHLAEKGKDRQLICRGPEREFLAWMHKNGLKQEIPRGVLVSLPEDGIKVANEIRVQSPITVLESND